MRFGARSEAPRRRGTTSSRINSLNNNATMADASTTLSVAVFAGQPRRFVAALKTELADPGRSFVDGQFAPRNAGRRIDQRPQFALQRTMIGFAALAKQRDLLLQYCSVTQHKQS
jgi:hypothetical protein